MGKGGAIGLGFSFRKIEIRRWVPFLVVLIALVGLIFAVADWKRIKPALLQASWEWIPYALAATLISYACISYSFARISRLLGVEMPVIKLTVVGFVSTVLNHLVLAGGAAGYSVRFLVMNKYGVTLREVVAISFLAYYLTSLMMVGMLPFALIYLSLNAELGQAITVALAISASLVLLGAFLATALVFWGGLRRKVTRALAERVRTVLGHDIRDDLGRFDTTMTLGVRAMREEPSSTTIIVILIVIDWAFSATALWFCFRAFGVTLSLGQLISGFVTGTVAGASSFIPGGLGIQEASMTGIYALLGIPLEKAVLAAILYRVVYSIVPYLVSLAFYRMLLRENDDGKSQVEQEADYENPYA
jgi:uncharacterized protein (TIRG00374 family)